MQIEERSEAQQGIRTSNWNGLENGNSYLHYLHLRRPWREFKEREMGNGRRENIRRKKINAVNKKGMVGKQKRVTKKWC